MLYVMKRMVYFLFIVLRQINYFLDDVIFFSRGVHRPLLPLMWQGRRLVTLPIWMTRRQPGDFEEINLAENNLTDEIHHSKEFSPFSLYFLIAILLKTGPKLFHNFLLNCDMFKCHPQIWITTKFYVTENVRKWERCSIVLNGHIQGCVHRSIFYCVAV